MNERVTVDAPESAPVPQTPPTDAQFTRSGRSIPTALPLALIACLAGALNLWNADFPLGFHYDEPLKLEFIKTGTQDFHHPVLMLQLVRLARLVVHFETDQQLVHFGRVLMGLCGVATVLLSYLLARARLSRSWALSTALAVAVSPILVVHAHYLDERTLFTTLLVAAALSFFRFVEEESPASTWWLGLTTGLVWSTHFEGILLLPLLLVAPLLGMRSRGASYFRRLFRSLLVASSVFFLVNWPLFVDFPSFLNGVFHGVEHASRGHDVVVHGYQYLFGFHLVRSLAPGMTWPALLVSLAGVAWCALRWSRLTFQERWIAAAALVLYLGVELPPLKPWPDFAAYAIPVVPFLFILAAGGAARFQQHMSSPARKALVGAVAAVAVVCVPLVDAVRLVHGLAHDSRTVAAGWLAANPGKALIERYAGPVASPGVRSVAMMDTNEFNRLGVDYVAASSFMYKRYEFGDRLGGQDSSVYQAHVRYTQLFSHPYIEIRPAYRSFAFSNPVIRIIDLRSPVERQRRPLRPPP